MENIKDLNLCLFDPLRDTEMSLPDSPGNYIVVLRNSSILPEIGAKPVMKNLEIDGRQFDVIYTGISSKSLRKRDYGQHFTGNNAGRSTLRKSLKKCHVTRISLTTERQNLPMQTRRNCQNGCVKTCCCFIAKWMKIKFIPWRNN